MLVAIAQATRYAELGALVTCNSGPDYDVAVLTDWLAWRDEVNA